MAEGFAKDILKKQFKVFSAGTEPKPIHPLAIQVMREVNIDISHQSSKHLNSLDQTSWDLLITVCDQANKACPLFSKSMEVAQTIHVPFPDPPLLAKNKTLVSSELESFRMVRNQIGQYIEDLKNEFETACM